MYVQYCDSFTVILFLYYSIWSLVKKEKGQAIATMADTNEGSTTGMTDEEYSLSEYLKKISY